MTPVRTAATPRRVLYRIGRLPDPLSWPPRDYTGGGRFDDPKGEFRVLYTGQRRACFLETLAPFRPSLEALAQIRQRSGRDEEAPRAVVPKDWYQRRAVAGLRLGRGQRWLDLRSAATRETLRSEMADTLLELGLADLDLSGVLGPRRQLTQAIARWAREQGHAGIAYRSRFDERLTLWAIFEGAAFERAGPPQPIVSGDPDLVAAARLFGLGL